MRVIAISSEHSKNGAIALVTEPPLTSEVFQEVERRSRTPALQALSLGLAFSCLIIHSDRFDPALRKVLEELLTEAEDVASGVAAKRQAEIDQSEKEITLESAAAGLAPAFLRHCKTPKATVIAVIDTEATWNLFLVWQRGQITDALRTLLNALPFQGFGGGASKEENHRKHWLRSVPGSPGSVNEANFEPNEFGAEPT